MATFTVNGKTVTVERNQKLLRYQRKGRLFRGRLRHLYGFD